MTLLFLLIMLIPAAALADVKVGGVILYDVKTTGYCAGPPCVDIKWADGKTASGSTARRGVCASDWKVFPKGTVINIPGYGDCRVEDTGNPLFVNGRHLDLFFDTEREAWNWGVRRKTVSITIVPDGYKPMIFGGGR